jgi:hypothetical protein
MCRVHKRLKSDEARASFGKERPTPNLLGVGLLRILQAGFILSDYATLMVEILKDNARSEASDVQGAMDMAWAKLVGRISDAYGK